jgi:hypothetical protein
VYFKEPGGVLFEIATKGPGFAVDEDPAHLGEALVLPPWFEPSRAEIERGLPPLTLPGSDFGAPTHKNEQWDDADIEYLFSDYRDDGEVK